MMKSEKIMTYEDGTELHKETLDNGENRLYVRVNRTQAAEDQTASAQEQSSLNLDINGDGKVDEKDAELAKKVLKKVGRRKKR